MRRRLIALMSMLLLLSGCFSQGVQPVAMLDGAGVQAYATASPETTPEPALSSESASGGSASRGENPADISYNQHQNILTVGTKPPGEEASPVPNSVAYPPGIDVSTETDLRYGTGTDAASKTNIYVQGEFDPDKPMVALTFDDGPGKATGRILEILERHGARATFFMVGSVAERKTDMVRRVAEQGSEIGNHTWKHYDLTKMTYEEVYDEFNRTNQLIEEITGMWPTVMRPVGGAYNDSVMRAAGELNLSVVNWSVDTKDWKNRNADSVYDATMLDARDGCIVICHDLYESTADAMERVIPELIEQGYQLVTVSELLSARPGGMEPGKLYTKK